jgi:hypothetical protein
MFNEMKILEGHIDPPVSGEKLLRGWNNRPGRQGACEAVLQTNGTTFRIDYQRWGNLKTIFEIEVGRLFAPGQPRPKITYAE